MLQEVVLYFVCLTQQHRNIGVGRIPAGQVIAVIKQPQVKKKE